MTLFLLYATTSAVILPAYAVEDAKTYYNRGTDYYEKADYEAAVKDLSTAIKLETKAPDAYFNRGLSYRKQHKIDEAIEDFSKAIQLYPNQPSYYFERCNAFILKNNFDNAVTDCSEAIRLLPDEASGYFMRGLAHMLRGDLEEAFADSVRSLQIQPDHSDALRLLYETLVKKEAMIGVLNSSTLQRSTLTQINQEVLPRGLSRAEKT